MVLHLDFECKNGVGDIYYSKGSLELNNGLQDLFWHILLLWCDLKLLLGNSTLSELVYEVSILKELLSSHNYFFKQAKVKKTKLVSISSWKQSLFISI